MGVFSSERLIASPVRGLRPVAEDLERHFQAKGYDVKWAARIDGAFDISITERNLFKAVAGLKTALNVELTPASGGVHVKAGIGIFGQQLIPTLITTFLFWPILATQIWGLVKQSKLDEEAIAVAETSLRGLEAAVGTESQKVFCPNCGASHAGAAAFCSSCGTPLARVPSPV